MKKFGIFVFVVIGLIALLALSAGFILPHFVSIDDYRQEIKAGFAEATGYELEFGDIELAVYPMIHASANNVEIINGKQTLANISQISAFADPWKLLKGEFEISSVEINSPKFSVTKQKNGTSWDKPANSTKSSAGESKASEKTSFSVDSISVTDGQVSFEDEVSQKIYKIDNLNLTTALKSLESPIDAVGNFEYDGTRFEVEASIPSEPNKNIELDLKGSETFFNFVGTAEKGEFSIDTGNAPKLLNTLGLQDTIKLTKPNAAASGSFSLNEQITVIDLTALTVGESSGTAKIGIDSNGKISADLKMNTLTVEDFLEESPSASSGAGGSTTDGLVDNEMNLRLSLKSGKLNYKDLKLTNFNLQSTVHKGEVVLQPLSFSFENGGHFEAFGVHSQSGADNQAFEGKVSTSGKDLYKILKSVDIDVSDINPNQLRNFSANTNLFVNIGQTTNVDVSSLKLSLGESKFSGSAQVKLQNTNEFTVRGNLDRLNLDNLFVEKTLTAAQAKTQAKDKRTLNVDWLKKLSSRANIALIINNLTSGGENYNNLRLVAAVKNKELDVQSLSVDALNTKISGKLKLNANGARPFITSDLSIGFLDFPEQNSSSASSSAKSASSRWSEEKFNLSPLDEFDSSFNIRLQGLRKGDLRFDNIIIRGSTENAKMNLSNLTARVFGGNLSVVGTIGVGVVPDFSLKIAGENFDLQSMALQLANNNKLVAGVMNLGGTLSSSGSNESTIIQNLQGGLGIAGTNIIVNGFDLEDFVRKLTNINNPVEVGLLASKVLNGQGQTLITALKGNWGIERGIANTSGLSLQTRVGEGKLTGSVDLPKWQMDTNATFLIALGDNKERPKVGVRMHGSIDKFKKDYDYSEVISYYSKRFGVSDKIGNIIGGFLGSGK